MIIDRLSKTIYYEPYELLIVSNYVEHCITNSERKNWRLVTLKKKPVELVKTSRR